MSVVIDKVTHLVFHGIGIADTTACGLLIGEGAPYGKDDTDCMACIAHGIRPGPVAFRFERTLDGHVRSTYVPGKHSETFQLTRVGEPGKTQKP